MDELLGEVLSLIEYSQLLGRLDHTAVKATIEEHAQKMQKATMTPTKGKGKGKGKQKEQEPSPFFVMNEMQNVAPRQQHRVFGLMLPSGKGSDVQQLYDDANTRFLEIEQVFKDFFGTTDQQL